MVTSCSSTTPCHGVGDRGVYPTYTAANWSTGSYAYDGTGNIISTYLSSSSLETYRYDGLSRLTSAKRTAAGASTTQTYVYDDYGNLTSYAGASLPTSTSTNRLTAATYEAAGHTTAWGGFTYTWDAQSQLIGESGNLLGRIFAYSADGERLLQRDGSTTTLSLRDLDGKVIRELSLAAGTAGAKWMWKRDNIYRNGLLLASVAPGEGIRHYHLDHLGTPRQVTNRTGQQLVRHDYWPYGREASLSGNQTPDRMRFTGHERDLNLLDRENDDLDYMHARYYNPTNLGRFMSVDPARGNVKRSQSFNLFTYVQGNPMKYVDPSGAFIGLISEEGQRTFYDAVTGSMAPGANKHLKWQNGRLVLVGMSAYAFSKMYGLMGRLVASWILSDRKLTMELGANQWTRRGEGGWTDRDESTGDTTIYLDPAKFGGLSLNRALRHELGHSIYGLRPGTLGRALDGDYGEVLQSNPFQPPSYKTEGLPMLFENLTRTDGEAWRKYYVTPYDWALPDCIPDPLW